MKCSIFTSHTEGINIDKDGGTGSYAWIFVLHGKEYGCLSLHVALKINFRGDMRIVLALSDKHLGCFAARCKEPIRDVIALLHHNYFPETLAVINPKPST